METRRHIYLRRDKQQNIHNLLVAREHGIDWRYVVHRRSGKKSSIDFFKCITPNLTIANVKKPPNFIRKFSPDGKYLICFSRDQQSIENYSFLGTTNACKLIYRWEHEYVPPDINHRFAEEIRQNIFHRLFQLNWSIQLTTFIQPLYREFSIFTNDGNFVIVASHTPVQEDSLPSFYALNSVNRVQLEYDLNTYRFFMLRLSDGKVCDIMRYTYDFINLSHNHGVSLNGNLLAIVSMFNQWIDIIQLNEGRFNKLFTIGRFFHGTEECMCSSVPEYKNDCIILDMKFGGLKHKMLVSIYKNILQCNVPDQRDAMLKHFYHRFKIYETMQIYKVQFIDAENLLIRYDNCRNQRKTQDVPDVSKLYIVYNITENEIVNIFPDKSADLLWLLTNFFDQFRNVRSVYTGRAPSSTNNNVYLQRAQMRLIQSYPNGVNDAAFRLLPQLPLSVQSYTISPYVDLNLFKYDDRLISAFERPRYSSCIPIRFCDRETNLTKFRIYPGIPNRFAAENEAQDRNAYRDLVAHIFHPFEPLIISVHKLQNRYVTNFHIRNEGTRVFP